MRSLRERSWHNYETCNKDQTSNAAQWRQTIEHDGSLGPDNASDVSGQKCPIAKGYVGEEEEPSTMRAQLDQCSLPARAHGSSTAPADPTPHAGIPSASPPSSSPQTPPECSSAPSENDPSRVADTVPPSGCPHPLP